MFDEMVENCNYDALVSFLEVVPIENDDLKGN